MNPLIALIGGGLIAALVAVLFRVNAGLQRRKLDESWTADEPLRGFIPSIKPLPPAGTPLTWHKRYTDDFKETWYELCTDDESIVGVMQFRPQSMQTALSLVDGRTFRLERRGRHVRLVAIPGGRVAAHLRGNALEIVSGPEAEWVVTDEGGYMVEKVTTADNGTAWVHIDTDMRQHAFDPTAITTLDPAAPDEVAAMALPLAYFIATDHYHDDH